MVQRKYHKDALNLLDKIIMISQTRETLLALSSKSFSETAPLGQFLFKCLDFPHFQHEKSFAWIFFPLAPLIVNNIELDEVLSITFHKGYQKN